jgi:hypothetical protein
MVWYKGSAHAPSSQPTGGGNGSLLYIKGGVAAGICVAVLLLYVLLRWVAWVRATRQTTPPPPGADEATISSLKTIAHAAPSEEEGRIECELRNLPRGVRRGRGAEAAPL